MIILGIDPGYERLGIAILKKIRGEKELVIHSECFKTSPSLAFPDRLLMIGSKVEEIIKKYKPEILSIESLFINTNQKTAMHVSEVRGVVLYEAKKSDLQIFEATPPQIKNAVTGYGASDKKQIIKMVKMLVELKKETNSDDELDAIAIALTAGVYLKV